MKPVIPNFLAAIVACIALLVLSGCKTTPQQAAYKTLKSVQQASVAGLTIYGEAYRRGDIDDATRAKVKDLYGKYQAAFSVAETAARFNYAAPSPPELTAALTELMQLINTLRK